MERRRIRERYSRVGRPIWTQISRSWIRLSRRRWWEMVRRQGMVAPSQRQNRRRNRCKNGDLIRSEFLTRAKEISLAFLFMLGNHLRRGGFLFPRAKAACGTPAE